MTAFKKAWLFLKDEDAYKDLIDSILIDTQGGDTSPGGAARAAPGMGTLAGEGAYSGKGARTGLPPDPPTILDSMTQEEADEFNRQAAMNPNKPPAPPVPTGQNPMLPTGPPKPDPFQPWRNEQFFGKKPVGVTPPVSEEEE